MSVFPAARPAPADLTSGVEHTGFRVIGFRDEGEKRMQSVNHISRTSTTCSMHPPHAVEMAAKERSQLKIWLQVKGIYLPLAVPHQALQPLQHVWRLADPTARALCLCARNNCPAINAPHAASTCTTTHPCDTWRHPMHSQAKHKQAAHAACSQPERTQPLRARSHTHHLLLHTGIPSVRSAGSSRSRLAAAWQDGQHASAGAAVACVHSGNTTQYV
jgi:hypothetical protein